ncbi:4'-phosphopantetheinyl transferase superfamily protein [Rhizobium lemnae]|uniref:Enterobactin synthase component D n=1 Tax=Rhizobium lemnae TaxID=1214924 RepID=A0ABV8E5L8_9HYPH|nr:4'-phosphopantetheinyl transferase superfamily protein [Rhizobium lemnae]MCJ8510645.1 4'-phosphopantetheinyl transferase superfamily protein [Rhizobium lemnae]
MVPAFEFTEIRLPGLAPGMLGIGTRYEPMREPVREAGGIQLPPALATAVPSRQLEYLAGRACAVEACRRLGLDTTPAATGLYREPIWPAGVVGSITHSKGEAIAVIAPFIACRSLGVDIEHIVDLQKAEDLFSVIADPAEANVLKDLMGDNLALIFTLIFCAKEAIFKATWPLVRRFIDFDEVRLVAAKSGSLTFAADAALASQLSSPGLPPVTYVAATSSITTLCVYR